VHGFNRIPIKTLLARIAATHSARTIMSSAVNTGTKTSPTCTTRRSPGCKYRIAGSTGTFLITAHHHERRPVAVSVTYAHRMTESELHEVIGHAS